MAEWPSSRARRVLAALYHIGWQLKRETASHRTLARDGSPHFVFACHDAEEIGPRMLARIAKRTGFTPNDLSMRANVRCTCRSGRHQVVCPSTRYEILIFGARRGGAPQVNSSVIQQRPRMMVESLSPDTQSVLRRALAFVSTTHELDGEFETRLGVDRGEITRMLMRWPQVDDHDDESSATVAINNALNEVVNGLHLVAEDWERLGASRAQVEAAYAEWVTKRR